MFGIRSLAVLLLVVSVSWLVGCAGTVPSQTQLWQESTGAKVAPPELARLNDLLVQLADRLKPALVQVRVRRPQPPPAEGKEPPRQPPDEGRRSTGSGFIIREDGLILTNAHVVAGAERIQVRLADGRRFDGKLIGKDSRVDLAVLQLEGARGLPVLAFGDSNAVRVGEFVMALGNPFGLEQTVSFGIVGRKGAPIQTPAPGFDFLQTDAAINPGNSGGPLANMAGEVIGVNSLAMRSGSLGFAIPINLVKALTPQLVANGKVEWGWLGVGIDEVSDEDLPKLGLSEPRGVIIRQVMPGEPADKAGLKTMDVVLGVNGEPVRTPRDLQRIIATSPPGKTLKLQIVREGKEAELPVVVGLYREPGSEERPRQ